MLRLIAFLLAVVVAVGGFVVIDYTAAHRAASLDENVELTFRDYLGKLPGRLIGDEDVQSILPPTLAEMMPKAPQGWTVRPALPDDAEAFLPRDVSKGSSEVRNYVAAVSKEIFGLGTEQVMLTYDRGRTRVIFQAVRFPDPEAMLSGLLGTEQLIEREMTTPQYRPTAFMTVRGLDVTEDLLPEGIRVRYFLSTVGKQIQIKVLASRRLTDRELIPFFETLNVKAMNTSVVAKQDGLGEVPVIVLASALDRETREAYDAARAPEAPAAAEPTEAEADGAGKLEMDSKLSGPNDNITCESRAGTKFCTIGDGIGATGGN